MKVKNWLKIEKSLDGFINPKYVSDLIKTLNNNKTGLLVKLVVEQILETIIKLPQRNQERKILKEIFLNEKNLKICNFLF